jgi:hypothetical protein
VKRGDAVKKTLRFATVLSTSLLLLASPAVTAFAASNTDANTTQGVSRPYPGWLTLFGSRGGVVKEIQAQLNKDGFSVGPVDGDFGPLTLHGVKAFQAAHHLVTDGVVGPVTWDALFPQGESPLVAAVQRYLQTRNDVVSFAVFDKLNNQTYVYNPYGTFDTASIVKPLILATLLHQDEVRHVKLTATENILAMPMIEQSNNSDATALWNLIGGSVGVQSFANLAGMHSTTADKYGYWGLTTTTALDQLHLMEDFAYPNPLLSAADRAYALNLMSHVVSWERWGVSAGVPYTAYLALKNGWLPLATGNWEINSVGYVDGGGRNYVIAVLTRNNPTEQYGIVTAEGISRIVFSDLGSTK